MVDTFNNFMSRFGFKDATATPKLVSKEMFIDRFRNIPVAINNLYGDPFFGKPKEGRVFSAQTRDTFEKLNCLMNSGHRGPVAIITKSEINDTIAKYLGFLSGHLNIVVLVSISDLQGKRSEDGKYLEPVNMGNRYNTLKLCVENGVKCIGYVRPFIPGLNDTKESIDKMFSSILETGCKTVVISGLRGNDEIFSKTGMSEEEAKLFNFRVKKIPAYVRELINPWKEKLNIFERTSCGVAYELKMGYSFNPYQAAPQLAGCLNCPLRSTCFDQRDSDIFKPTKEDEELVNLLGYDAKLHIYNKCEMCRVIPEKRTECRSCCTSCYQLQRNSVELTNPEKHHLGDSSLLRFLLGGKLVWGKDLHEREEIEYSPSSDLFQVDELKNKIYMVNSWWSWSKSTNKCYNCSYCLISGKYDEAMLGDFGSNPVKTAEILWERITNK